jgi:hypothetical protein
MHGDGGEDHVAISCRLGEVVVGFDEILECHRSAVGGGLGPGGPDDGERDVRAAVALPDGDSGDRPDRDPTGFVESGGAPRERGLRLLPGGKVLAQPHSEERGRNRPVSQAHIGPVWLGQIWLTSNSMAGKEIPDLNLVLREVLQRRIHKDFGGDGAGARVAWRIPTRKFNKKFPKNGEPTEDFGLSFLTELCRGANVSPAVLFREHPAIRAYEAREAEGHTEIALNLPADELEELVEIVRLAVASGRIRKALDAMRAAADPEVERKAAIRKDKSEGEEK